MSHFPEKPTNYHHFILLLWHEHNGAGKWRISLQDPHTEARIGFKNINGLTAYLEQWMNTSSTDDSNKQEDDEDNEGK